MHPPSPHNPGLLQLAEKAQHFADHNKQGRMAVVFQTVSVISVAVMGLAASAHLIRELFGHGNKNEHGHSHGPQSNTDRAATEGHAARVHDRRARHHWHER